MKLKNTLLLATFSLITTIIAASGANIPITGLPLYITTPGTYVLNKNLNYLATNNMPAIVIANNITGTVVVDLNGFTIIGGGEISQNNESFGVSIGYYNVAMTNVSPITIRNGTLTNFTVGIDGLQGGRASLINVTLNKLNITHPQAAVVQTTAIALSAKFSTVSNCNLSHYEFGITLNSTSIANNSYTYNTFTSVSSPFLVAGSVLIGIPMVTDHLQSPK
jgi:hypothetical protein